MHPVGEGVIVVFLALGTSLSKIQPSFRQTVVEVMDGDMDGEEKEILSSERSHMSEPIPLQVPLEVPSRNPTW